jgi:hypothetical protein
MQMVGQAWLVLEWTHSSIALGFVSVLQSVPILATVLFASVRPARGSRRMTDELSFPYSLCHHCDARRYVPAKGNVFIRCTRLAVKYPRQPVRSCGAYRPAVSTETAPERRGN